MAGTIRRLKFLPCMKGTLEVGGVPQYFEVHLSTRAPAVVSHVEKHVQLKNAPQSGCICLPTQNEKGVACSYKHGKALQALRNIVLVNANLVQPKSWRSPMLFAKSIAPFAQGFPFGVHIIVPRMAEKGIAITKLRRSAKSI